MDIVFSVNNNQEIMILPIVPPNCFVDAGQENEDFAGLNGSMKLIGEMGLKKLKISSFFPVNKDYRFQAKGSESDGWAYVEFFERNRKRKIPFRVVVTAKDGKTRLNMACVINDFSYGTDEAGDIAYTLEVEEYRFG